MKKTVHLLFSYGTLQFENVQLKHYGRILKGVKDKLIDYKIEKLQITDATVLAKSELEFHPIAVKSKHKTDIIEGLLYEITDIELATTDFYEVSDYHRILETFKSGKKAWMYVAKNRII